MVTLSYVNSKGATVPVIVTEHAKKRFIQRYHTVFGEDISSSVYDVIERYFKRCVRIQNTSMKEKARLKRYGADTMFFRTTTFTFVVQNATIVTIEISGKDMRHLNKISA